jgi:hypothetical protein
MPVKGIFGSVIISVLLVLYVYLVGMAVWAVMCSPSPSCSSAFTEEMGSALLLVGGLIAAPVIVELARADSGKVPAQLAFGLTDTSRGLPVLKIFVVVYFGFWVVSGLIGLFFGWRFPQEAGALSKLGTNWLGLAVAAGYAYFGATPPTLSKKQVSEPIQDKGNSVV